MEYYFSLSKLMNQKPKPIKIPEKQIQKAVLDYLSYLKNIYYFRAGSGIIRTELGNYFKSGKSGCPDIIICYKGVFIGFEIKTATGKQSDVQRIAEETINNSGGKYFIIRSLDDAKIALDSI